MTYQIKLRISTNLSDPQFADELQKLWDRNSISGQFSVKSINGRVELTITRSISDNIPLIHAKLFGDINEQSVSSAIAFQFAIELEKFFPPATILDEKAQIARALSDLRFEIIGLHEVIAAVRVVRDEVAQLFFGFIHASEALSNSAIVSENGLAIVKFDDMERVRIAREKFLKYPGLNTLFGELIEDTIYGFQCVSDSMQAVKGSSDTCAVDVKSIENLLRAIHNIRNNQDESDELPRLS